MYSTLSPVNFKKMFLHLSKIFKKSLPAVALIKSFHNNFYTNHVTTKYSKFKVQEQFEFEN